MVDDDETREMVDDGLDIKTQLDIKTHYALINNMSRLLSK